MRPRPIDEFLKKARVPFTVFQHPAAFTAERQAALSHVPGRSWAKTVACIADDQLVLAVVPAHLKVHLEQLRELIPAAIVRLASEQELAHVWPGCEPGTTLPFATQSPVRVFVDRSFVGEPEMVFSAGTHTDAIRIHYWDFYELTHPVVGQFATRAEAIAT